MTIYNKLNNWYLKFRKERIYYEQSSDNGGRIRHKIASPDYEYTQTNGADS